jgi:PIN domain nuclease of toxin-antitoxin system
MNLLIDTHIILWWLDDSPRLKAEYRKILTDTDNLCYVSAATIWEISIKTKLGKLDIPDNYLDTLKDEGFQELPVKWSHSRYVNYLPLIHRDPFDRLLVAQAKVEDLTLLSTDTYIRQYDIKVI